MTKRDICKKCRAWDFWFTGDNGESKKECIFELGMEVGGKKKCFYELEILMVEQNA